MSDVIHPHRGDPIAEADQIRAEAMDRIRTATSFFLTAANGEERVALASICATTDDAIRFLYQAIVAAWESVVDVTGASDAEIVEALVLAVSAARRSRKGGQCD